MRVIAKAITVLTLAVALVLMPQTASARTSPVPIWGAASCASGSLFGFEMSNNQLIVVGDAARCDDGVAPALFAVAVFRAGATQGTVVGTREFYAPGVARAFGVLGLTSDEPWGVCAMSGPDVRLACGRVGPAVATPPWAFEDISVTDPLVARPASYSLPRPGGTPPNPICGGCF